MPNHNTSRSVYTELFKEASIIQRIREQYTQKLNSKFPNGMLLDPYQNKKKNKIFDAHSLPASEIIQRAYPPLKYDANGVPIDNREQEFIDTVNNFSKKISNKKKMTKEEQELNCATKVYAALSSVETQQERLKLKLKDIEKNFVGQDKEEAIQLELQLFRSYCNQLLDALNEHQRILAKQSEKTKVDKTIKALEDFIELISSLWNKKKLRSKVDDPTIRPCEQIHKKYYANKSIELRQLNPHQKPEKAKKSMP